MKVYLLRHGETEGNLKGTFSGVTDTPLTEYGKVQAKRAHQKLKGESFDVVLSSPLSRAKDTARIACDNEILIDERLIEMNFGIFEGLTYHELLEKYPKESDTWHQNHDDYDFETGESLKNFYNRVNDAYKDILKKHKVEKLLIVAHSGVIRSILAHEISERFDHYWKYKVDNCGVAIIDYSDGYTILEASNL